MIVSLTVRLVKTDGEEITPQVQARHKVVFEDLLAGALETVQSARGALRSRQRWLALGPGLAGESNLIEW